MPLFTFKCRSCAKIAERLVNDENTVLECECGSKELDRQFRLASSSRIWRGAQDYFENVINPEVDKIQKELSEGKDSTFLDVTGDE